MTATVNVPGEALADEVDAALITARSAGNSAISDSATLTTSVATVSGVDLAPGAPLTGAAGEAEIFTVPITSTGNVSDVFDLEGTGNVWPTILSVDSMSLPAGGQGLVMVTVAVPSSAVYRESDAATVTATSHRDATNRDTAVLTTFGNGLSKMYLPVTIRSVRPAAGERSVAGVTVRF